MKYYIISGEASGDLHGANLIKELVKLDPAADIRCWGGDMMEAAGAKVVKHYKELAFMGFKEVIANIGTILSNINFCKKTLYNLILMWLYLLIILVSIYGLQNLQKNKDSKHYII